MFGAFSPYFNQILNYYHGTNLHAIQTHTCVHTNLYNTKMVNFM